MCFGTFDNLHPGHLSYLKNAKEYGDYLIVIIARDKNVKKNKGRFPRQTEKIRLKSIKEISFVDKAVLGQLKDKFKVIEKYQPDVICLGYDQKADISKLKRCDCEFKRLSPYKPHIYKSSKINRK